MSDHKNALEWGHHSECRTVATHTQRLIKWRSTHHLLLFILAP